jgi:hypothetical protein
MKTKMERKELNYRGVGELRLIINFSRERSVNPLRPGGNYMYNLL